MRLLGYKGPIAVIGNPVAVPVFTEEIFSARLKTLSPSRCIAFLGRLHPRKGVENLLHGAALAANKDIRVLVIGKGESSYEHFLQSEAERLGIANRVEFLGFLNGFDKYNQLSMADALFVPSDMENFGMIIPEALIVGTPVMASIGTPWEVLNTERCGWWRDNSPESISKVIDEIYSMPWLEYLEAGKRGREYIIKNFIGEKVASQMHELYRWILGENVKPDFVCERF